ncbi:hypothetical protein EDC04DRAFT_2618427, partial [Pisolithus marmoratus]
HPKLKPILHKKVLEMCGIDMLGQADCLKTLAQYQHGLPNQWPSEEVDGQIIWRPAWSEHVDHTVNIRFLHSIMDGIMEDEKQTLKGKQNEKIEFQIKIIIPDGASTSSSRGHGGVQKKFGIQGAAAMINSDFGLDNQTIDEESLSEDMNM